MQLKGVASVYLFLEVQFWTVEEINKNLIKIFPYPEADRSVQSHVEASFHLGNAKWPTLSLSKKMMPLEDAILGAHRLSHIWLPFAASFQDCKF